MDEPEAHAIVGNRFLKRKTRPSYTIRAHTCFEAWPNRYRHKGAIDITREEFLFLSFSTK